MGQSCILTVGFSTRNFFLFFFSFFFLFFYFQSASAASRRNKKTGDHLATMKVTIFCSALALFLAVWTEAAPVENGDIDYSVKGLLRRLAWNGNSKSDAGCCNEYHKRYGGQCAICAPLPSLAELGIKGGF